MIGLSSGDGEIATEAWPNYPWPGTRASDDDCNPLCAVYINGVEVPAVSTSDDDLPMLECNIQRGGEGTADIMRASDVTVPLEWGGKEVGPVAEILRRQPDRAVSVRIEVKAPDDTYSTVHDGFLAGAGPHKGNSAVALRVNDFSKLFESIGFGGEYGYDVDVAVGSVVEGIVSEVAEAHEAVNDLAIEADVGRLYPDDAMDRNATVDMVDGTPVLEDLYQLMTEQKIISKRTFDRTRSTAADAMDWVCSLISADWQIHWDPVEEQTTVFVDPTGTGPLFVDVRTDREFKSLTESDPFETDLTEGRPVIVQNNNAAWQISALHTLLGRGNTVQTDDGSSSKIREGKARPVATVAHETLRSMVGDNGSPPIEPVDAQTVDEVERETRSILREKIRKAMGGEIITLPEGTISPGATVKAVPVCGGEEVGDFDALRFEVGEVIHHVSPVTPGGGANQKSSRTLLRCGLSVQDDDFETLEAGLMKV